MMQFIVDMEIAEGAELTGEEFRKILQAGIRNRGLEESITRTEIYRVRGAMEEQEEK